MRPIPVSFHIGPLLIHTYGIGLAITFWFAYRYFERRLRNHGYPTDWLVSFFVWVIVAAIVGARVFNVITNLGYYRQDPVDVFAIWHGGLSSFGGLIFAVPTGMYLAWRRCPELRISKALDLVAPVLAAAWSMGRFLGPQLMVAGGGHPTRQWFGMYYATQVGKRLPVPIFQGTEDFVIFLVLLYVERRVEHWPDGSARSGYPAGAVIGTGMVLWGIERGLDQRLWLAYPNNLGSELVQLAGVGLVLSGLVVLALSARHWHAWLAVNSPPGTGATSEIGATREVAEGAGSTPATVSRSATR